jgi:hypothetical protein
LESVSETSKLWKENFEALEQVFGKKTKQYEAGLAAYVNPDVEKIGIEIDKLL